jgi:hypothetical protein
LLDPAAATVANKTAVVIPNFSIACPSSMWRVR